jgi:hypothetical protein
MGVLKGFVWVLILGICTLCSCSADAPSITDWIEAGASMIGLFLSAIAVIYAHKAFNQAEITAKNSLRPILTLSRYDHQKTEGLLVLELKNNGVGPAVIKEMTWYFDSEIVNEKITDFISKKFKEKYSIIYEEKFPFDIDGTQLNAGPTTVIKDGEKEYLIAIKELYFGQPQNLPKEHINIMWEIIYSQLNKLSFYMVYESIYRDETILHFGDFLPNAPSPTKS